MKWVGRFFLGLLVLAGLSVAFALFSRHSLAEWAMTWALHNAGYRQVDVEVASLSFDRLTLYDLAIGPAAEETVFLDRVDVSYDIETLIRERRVNSVRAGPGRISVRIASGGNFDLGLTSAQSNDDKSRPLPFETLLLERLEIEVETPEGKASALLNADYSAAKGGDIALEVETDSAGFDLASVENAEADIKIIFAESGDMRGEGKFRGDIYSAYGDINQSDIRFSGGGNSWRDLARGDFRNFTAAALVSVENTIVDIDANGPLSALNLLPAPLGGAVNQVSASGEAKLRYENGIIIVESDDETLLQLETDTGVMLSASSNAGEPLFYSDDKTSRIAALTTARSGVLSAAANVSAERVADGWLVDAPIRISGAALETLSFSDTSASLKATFGPDRITAETALSGALERADIGRFSMRKASVEGQLLADIDLAGQVAIIRLPQETCFKLKTAEASVIQQNMRSRLNKARLCPSDQPLLTLNWREDPSAVYSANVDADDFSFQMGETIFEGMPPRFELAGAYQPSENLTNVSGSFAGGTFTINDLLKLEAAEGVLTASLNKDALSASADLKRTLVREAAATPNIAPLVASVSATLEDDVARFDYSVETPRGVALGRGQGRHDLSKAEGVATFRFDRLRFAAGGLQPDRLAPVLKGFIGLTTGAADGSAEFSWRPEGVESEAALSFDNVTFGGPGLTVTQTKDLTGALSFASLTPLQTDGAQILTIGGVDFGALQLEDGEVRFALPGDETLVIESAVFPWFGGAMAVRDATAALDGGTVTAPLSVEAVDLSLILDYVDIDGLSGAGTLNGVLPIVVKDGRASIEDGALTAEGPGVLRYVGQAGAAASAAGDDAKIAFDVLRNLEYERLEVRVDGPLDGRLDFRIQFEGSGDVQVNRQNVRVPVKYNITLDAALLELLNQANLSRDLQMQIEQAVSGAQ
ncbi:MAG: YdbH domain-containing protein [Pseudomonadota bacterium]